LLVIIIDPFSNLPSAFDFPLLFPLVKFLKWKKRLWVCNKEETEEEIKGD
jgi:hypothetical protein